jgi:hypothetical protein
MIPISYFNIGRYPVTNITQWPSIRSSLLCFINMTLHLRDSAMAPPDNIIGVGTIPSTENNRVVTVRVIPPCQLPSPHLNMINNLEIDLRPTAHMGLLTGKHAGESTQNITRPKPCHSLHFIEFLQPRSHHHQHHASPPPPPRHPYPPCHHPIRRPPYAPLPMLPTRHRAPRPPRDPQHHPFPTSPPNRRRQLLQRLPHPRPPQHIDMHILYLLRRL